jgi:hypothetical protein
MRNRSRPAWRGELRREHKASKAFCNSPGLYASEFLGVADNGVIRGARELSP